MDDDMERFEWAERLDAALTAVERLAAITPGAAGLVHADLSPLDPCAGPDLRLGKPPTFEPGPVMGALEAACDLVRSLCERGARWAGADVPGVTFEFIHPEAQRVLDEAVKGAPEFDRAVEEGLLCRRCYAETFEGFDESGTHILLGVVERSHAIDTQRPFTAKQVATASRDGDERLGSAVSALMRGRPYLDHHEVTQALYEQFSAFAHRQPDRLTALPGHRFRLTPQRGARIQRHHREECP